MTLSLDDVRNKRFRMARKGGYEVLEVDEFVDEVEESFAQLVEENASLKKQVDALRSDSGDQSVENGDAPRSTTAEPETAQPIAPAQPAQATQPAQVTQPGPSPRPVPTAQTGAPVPVNEDRVVVTTSAEASTAVVRLVQLSTEQAERLVHEATDEAARIREDAGRDAQQVTEDARTRAERLGSEARVDADRVQAEAQGRSESMDQELGQRRTELLSDLDREHGNLTDTVARLRDFEQRYRSSLQEHLQGQLTDLEHVGLEPQGGPDRSAPRSAADDEAQAGAEPAATDGPAVERGDGNAAGPGTGSSATPRLDALLGEQR